MSLAGARSPGLMYGGSRGTLTCDLSLDAFNVTYPHPRTDGCLWKHYLPATSFAGDKNRHAPQKLPVGPSIVIRCLLVVHKKDLLWTKVWCWNEKFGGKFGHFVIQEGVNTLAFQGCCSFTCWEHILHFQVRWSGCITVKCLSILWMSVRFEFVFLMIVTTPRNTIEVKNL